MSMKFLICLLLAGTSLSAQESYTYSYNGPPLPIFTDAANLATIASIRVSRTYTVQNVAISVNILYYPVGDINMYAYAPDGTRTKLVERNCGDQGTLVNISFEDSAASEYADFCPAEPGKGAFRGNEPLSNFNGKDSFGTWYLAVENNGSQRIGWINGWSITLSGPAITTPALVDVVNRSSLESGAVAPNSDIIAYGSNLGPADPVFAPANQTLPTTLSGVQVLLNGSAIPLKAVYSTAVDAVVPTDVAIGSTANFQVVVNGTSSNTVSTAVQASAPGLFSQGKLTDQGAASWTIVTAFDQNFNPINADNPAVQGSIITLYATGLGATTPSLPAGEVPPSSPLHVVTTPANVSIGGVAGAVLFAGLAPGFPGVYQMNIEVPTGIGGGNQLIILWSGGGVSQDTLSIPVKLE